MSKPSETWIQANNPPQREPWEFGIFDKVNQTLVLRGTWLFREPLNVEAMQEGLRQVLEHYPHLAGRVEDNKRVLCNNAGLPFYVAPPSEHTLKDFETNLPLAKSFAAPLSKRQFKKGRSAGISVQVTPLTDGYVLAVSCVHTLMDGQSFYTMIHHWSRLTRGLPIENSPLLDQTLFPELPIRPKPEVIQAAEDKGWPKLSPWKMLRLLPFLVFGRHNIRKGPFWLSEEGLTRLKETAREESQRNDLGTNDVLVAHVSLLTSRLLKHAPDTVCKQAVVLDTRLRIPEIPSSFVGNAAFVAPGATYTPTDTLGTLAARTHDALQPYLQKPSPELTRYIHLTKELMHHKVLRTPVDYAAMHGRRPTLPYCNNFTRFPIYDVDFGTPEQPNQPVFVVPHDLPDPIMFWPAPPQRGGVEIYLSGGYAMALSPKDSNDPWWRELLMYEG
ncbi:MAG: hypothetical protein EP343_12495 [Deltaproteobacteria bacterium]|nr:MAG: hypothetical protein EP343_12495 [Deltaproteobacteria bacterium]